MVEKLPAVIASRGGVLTQVLSWEQHLSLSPKVMMGILLIVDQYPDLNTESSIDMLAEAAGRHGEKLDKWFANLVHENGIDTIYMAIEAMEHLGLRSPTTSSVLDLTHDEFLEQRYQLDAVIEVLVRIQEARSILGVETDTTEGICILIEHMGGWHVVVQMEADEMIKALANKTELE